MQFQVTINGVTQTPVEADNGHEAVDKARAAHTPPHEGGDFDIIVSCSTPWLGATFLENKVMQPGRTHAPGVVSEFSVRHEPHESLRPEIEAKAKAAEEEAAREALREEGRAQVRAENAAAAAKGGVK